MIIEHVGRLENAVGSVEEDSVKLHAETLEAKDERDRISKSNLVCYEKGYLSMVIPMKEFEQSGLQLGWLSYQRFNFTLTSTQSDRHNPRIRELFLDDIDREVHNRRFFSRNDTPGVYEEKQIIYNVKMSTSHWQQEDNHKYNLKLNLMKEQFAAMQLFCHNTAFSLEWKLEHE